MLRPYNSQQPSPSGSKGGASVRASYFFLLREKKSAIEPKPEPEAALELEDDDEEAPRPTGSSSSRWSSAPPTARHGEGDPPPGGVHPEHPHLHVLAEPARPRGRGSAAGRPRSR